MVTTKTISKMIKAMDWAAERHKILTHNIANADTPGYKRRDLDFSGELRKSTDRLELTMTHPRHQQKKLSQDGLSREDWGAVRIDQNNVDLEVEEIRSAENALYFQGLTQELNNQFRRLRMAIGGRS